MSERTTIPATHMYDFTTTTSGEPKPETILQEAERLINGPRRDDYGDVQTSFEKIRRLWSETLKVELTATHVAICMIQLKIARLSTGTITRDSIVDIAGYAGLLGKLNGFE